MNVNKNYTIIKNPINIISLEGVHLGDILLAVAKSPLVEINTFFYL